jgi:hypothetical protein
MADYASSLPIRTQNNGDVIAHIADGTVTSQLLKVEADGSINVNSTISATDLDIRDLVFATDKVDVSGSTVELGATTLAALESITVVDGGGSLTVDAVDLDIRDLVFATDKVDVSGSSVELGATTLAALESITVSATDLDIRDLAFATDKVDVSGSEVSLDATTLAALENITVSATDLDIRDLAFATDKVDVSGSTVELGATTLAALESITVVATDLDIRDLTHASDSVKIGDGTDFLAVNTDGSINVKITDGSPGTEVNDYDTDAAVAGGDTGTHTYTSGGNFYLQQIEASGSGKIKIVVKVNGVTKFVGFNSTANPNISFHLEQPILATSGQTVTVERTNKENQPQDVYSTISGYLA